MRESNQGICKRNVFLFSALYFVSLVVDTSLTTAVVKPNIIVILADDLGIDCVESYGGLSFQTPNIDQLGNRGIRFTHCFANPYCTPSRAQLLTGRYPIHTGLAGLISEPKHHQLLDPLRETSVARLLKDAGYATVMAGKWQLSLLDKQDVVRQHGFDEYQCWQTFKDGEKTSRYANPTMRQNGKVLSEELVGEYGPDHNLDFILDFIVRHQQQPLFVYYASLLPHWPWEPTPDCGEPLKPGSGRGNPRYVANMVRYLDEQVGKIMTTLDRLELRSNTLVLFVADNGTDQHLVTTWSDGVREIEIPGGKGKMTDTGSRVPLIANWPGTIAPGQVNNDLIDLSDILPTLVEVARAADPPRPINGVSFAPQLYGESGYPRRWIHVQKAGERHVRDNDFILSDIGELRPVVDYSSKPSQPVSPSSSENARQSFNRLETVLKRTTTFETASFSSGD